ncbi:hypothetical protein KVV02_005024 [Mortierella alpina]|uniref:Uncharacterized protein n=1 Tax=Mortierella alpina TaxID=64518 RepID=A0A9P8A1Q6_MORAP|nr:hypothetical protein KVV02_005024 [Mortierella alpina]
MLDSGCAGFPLGYPSRGDRDINTKYTYLVQDRRPDAPVCQPGRQTPGNNPFPPASVIPGQRLHLTWQPDGHLDNDHPSTIEVHWSGVPEKQLQVRSELGPATLLGTMIFATSNNCDQAWEPNTWCHGHITIPESTQPGTYQLVWWWKYDRNPSGEEYSTCFEIVVGGNGGGILPREIEVKARGEGPAQAPGAASSSASVPAPVPDNNTTPQALQLAYMTSDSETSESSDPVRVNKDTSQEESLTGLIAQPDEPLSVVPNASIKDDSKQGRHKTNGYLDDDTGALAGDAINGDEGEDTSPLPVVSPSQLINSTLAEQLQTNSSTSHATPSGAKSNTTESTPVHPTASADGGRTHDRALAGLPPLDSGASGIWVSSVCGYLVLASVLATGSLFT